MCSLNHPTLITVIDSAYQFASESLFFNNFTEQSKACNDQKMIEIIRGIPELENLTIRESYNSKNNEQAKKLLKEAEKTKNIKAKTSYFTKALFAAKFESNDQIVFFDALMRSIRWSFASGNFKKSYENCKYMISLWNEQICPNLNDKDYYAYKIECMSYETRCLKILGDPEKAEILARNGIREAKNFFQKMEEEGVAITDEMKLEKLRPFLGVLNEIHNDAKKCVAPRAAIIKSEEISLPEVFGKQNVKLPCCSDAIELRYDEAKGRHLVATRNIKTGSVLIVDEPFTWSTEKEMLENNCLHCHKSLRSTEAVRIPCHNCQTVKFCSEDCRLESWTKYHRWECVIFDYFYQMRKNQSSRLLLAYRTTVRLSTRNVGSEDNRLSPELMKYYSKSGSDASKLEIGLNATYDPLDYRTVYSLQTNGKDIDPKVNLMHAIYSVLLAKCFRFVSKKLNPNMKMDDEEESLLAIATLRHLQSINSNAYEIVENVLDPLTKIWEPRTVGGAIYATVSLSNHSCFPNVVRHTYPKGKIAVRAVRFIRKGAEILDCYGPHYLRDAKSNRQEYLLKKYNFYCNCEACDKNLGPFSTTTLYRCKNCLLNSEELSHTCSQCGAKNDKVKIDKSIKESIEQRSIAIQNMLEGNHAAALPILLHHAELVDKIYAASSFEAVKTQQALIQCLNSMGCISE